MLYRILDGALKGSLHRTNKRLKRGMTISIRNWEGSTLEEYPPLTYRKTWRGLRLVIGNSVTGKERT